MELIFPLKQHDFELCTFKSQTETSPDRPKSPTTSPFVFLPTHVTRGLDVKRSHTYREETDKIFIYSKDPFESKSKVVRDDVLFLSYKVSTLI